MRKLLLLLSLVISSCLNVYSQATSMTVDCQNPGWLSFLINYGDQQTLENIKVTGYINGTDIKFLRELNLNRSLSGVINLEDANIVAGGESYGGSDNYVNVSTTTQDNTISPYMFAYLNPIRKVILPKSITNYEGNYLFLNTKVDTLIINGNFEGISIGDGHDNIFWKTRCIYFPEGVKNINLNYLFHSYAGLSNIELFFPSTLEKITGKNRCVSEDAVIHCSSINPEIIQDTNTTNQWGHYSNIFWQGIIYVPKGTKEKYEQSIFNKLTIIEDIHVEGITLDQNKFLYVGDETKLIAQVLPEDALNKGVIWESSNPEIIEIADDGSIKAMTYGTAIITATTVDGEFKASCTINVYEHTTGIEMNDYISISIDDTYTLNAHTLPLSTSDERITFSSSNSDIASVNDQGIVIARKKGTCTITATSVDGGYTATCEVIVTQPAEAVTLEKHSLTLKVGDTDQLFAQITPATADNKVIDWSSSDEEVVSVDASGNIVALKPGEAWVKAVSNDNAAAKDSCKVTVTQSVSGITLAQDNYTLLSLDETVQIEATVLPADATNKDIRWSSSNENVCVVNDGKVTPTGYGMAIVMASTIEGGYSASCIVKVLEMGDANGDCVIDKADAEEVAYYILGRPSSKFIFVLADVNEDKKISILDAVGIINIAIMKSTASARLKALDEQ